MKGRQKSGIHLADTFWWQGPKIHQIPVLYTGREQCKKIKRKFECLKTLNLEFRSPFKKWKGYVPQCCLGPPPRELAAPLLIPPFQPKFFCQLPPFEEFF